ncbi:MAG: hypothetical protein LC644_05170, partial [Pseudonocardia sp.]|nr:hypothetical protein [Pseudonocardia sp.]
MVGAEIPGSKVGAEDPLSRAQRWFLSVLGLPAFGVAFAYTVVGTYLPVLLAELSGPAVTGLLIGGEGVVALIVPVVVGRWSDSTSDRHRPPTAFHTRR